MIPEPGFGYLKTPDDDEPQVRCKGCNFSFWSTEDLSKAGYCAWCEQRRTHYAYCNNCYWDGEIMGIPTACPNCHKESIFTDERFIDDLIAEKQKAHPHLTFASIAASALTLALSLRFVF